MRIQFDYTGSSQTYTVPSGVTSIYIDISGASGGNPDPAADGADPGLGGHVELILTVTAGDVLTIDVGGQGTDATVGSTAAGGWNGGGTGGRAAAAGGGCTAVYLNAVLVAVAGGGAGGGANGPTGTGGDGGADNGADGHVGALLGVNSGGKGGTPSAGGTGGAATGSGAVNGTSGSSLQGGTGATGAGDRGGGGGGGGYYGGGGGGARPTIALTSGAGGGGGSNHIATITEILATITNAVGGNAGAGWVRLTYASPSGWHIGSLRFGSTAIAGTAFTGWT